MRYLLRNPFTLLIHVALAVILAGATVTHFFGIQGTVTLKEGDAPSREFKRTSGPGDGLLPFTLALEKAEVVYYPGTTAPMDFRSHLRAGGRKVTVAMNAVAEIDGWRFYQSGMREGGSTLAVSHDPVGTGITYTGYALLLIGMAGFFAQKRTVWRALLRSRVAATLLLLTAAGTASAAESTPLHTMQRPLAANFGKVYVYWHDRVAPMRTMALDVTVKLYGSTSYRGMTADQVLTGWLFHYDEWLRDYETNHLSKDEEDESMDQYEREALISWLGTGEAFRIYPYHASTGRMEWLSLSERRPSDMPPDQWRFMVESMPEIAGLLQQGRNNAADDAISRLIEGQRRYAGARALPDDRTFQAELFYDSHIRILPAAILTLIFGIFGIIRGLSPRAPRRASRIILLSGAFAATIYFGSVLALRGWIGGRWPLTDGFETMLFMAFAAALGALCCRDLIVRGSLLGVAAMAAFVAAMTAKNPQIGSLAPVLASPLLSIHVMLVMISYVLFLLMAILSVISLVKGGDLSRRLARLDSIILTPAVFLLSAGIFIGAVWANQTWGRYWGWDPKETCALITLLVYALPVHRRSIPLFRRPKALHIYLAVAILSVIITYFGANYIFHGLHSYA